MLKDETIYTYLFVLSKNMKKNPKSVKYFGATTIEQATCQTGQGGGGIAGRLPSSVW